MADGDLISRESLLAGIAELKQSPWYNFGKADRMNLEGMEALWQYGYQQRKEAVQVIEEVCINEEPAVRANSGWISLKERLPDNVEEVLIYCPEFCEKIKQATWCGEDFFVEREDLIVEPAPNGYCTHWMPLPEPPKGE